MYVLCIFLYKTIYIFSIRRNCTCTYTKTTHATSPLRLKLHCYNILILYLFKCLIFVGVSYLLTKRNTLPHPRPRFSPKTCDQFLSRQNKITVRYWDDRATRYSTQHYQIIVFFYLNYFECTFGIIISHLQNLVKLR